MKVKCIDKKWRYFKRYRNNKDVVLVCMDCMQIVSSEYNKHTCIRKP